MARVKCSRDKFFKILGIVGIHISGIIFRSSESNDSKPSIVEMGLYARGPFVRALLYKPKLFVKKKPEKVFEPLHWEKVCNGYFSSEFSGLIGLELNENQVTTLRLEHGAILKIGYITDRTPPIVIRVEEVGGDIFLNMENLRPIDCVVGTKLNVSMIKKQPAYSAEQLNSFFITFPEVMGIQISSMQKGQVDLSLHGGDKLIVFSMLRSDELFEQRQWDNTSLATGVEFVEISIEAGFVLRAGTPDAFLPQVILHIEKGSKDEIFLVLERPGAFDVLLGSSLNTSLVSKINETEVNRPWSRFECQCGAALKVEGRVCVHINNILPSSLNVTLLGCDTNHFIVQKPGKVFEYSKWKESKIDSSNSLSSKTGEGAMNTTLKPGFIIRVASLNDLIPPVIFHVEQEGGLFFFAFEKPHVDEIMQGPCLESQFECLA